MHKTEDISFLSTFCIALGIFKTSNKFISILGLFFFLPQDCIIYARKKILSRGSFHVKSQPLSLPLFVEMYMLIDLAVHELLEHFCMSF